MTEPVKRKRGRPRKSEQNGVSVKKTDLSNKEDIEKVVNGRKRQNVLSATGEYGTEPGDNSRFLRMALESWDLPPVDISDPKQVEDRIKLYFNHCVENDRKPTIVSMANWLGISRDTLNSWKRGEFRSETHTPIIKKAFAVLEEQWADYMMNGKINPAAGIFIGKNWYQYADAQQIVVTPSDPYAKEKPDDIRQRYLEGVQNDILADGDVE